MVGPISSNSHTNNDINFHMISTWQEEKCKYYVIPNA